MATPTIARAFTGRQPASAATVSNDTIDEPTGVPNSLSPTHILNRMVCGTFGAITPNKVHATLVSSGPYATSISITIDTGSGASTVVLTPAAPGFDLNAATEALKEFNNMIDRGFPYPSLIQPGSQAV